MRIKRTYSSVAVPVVVRKILLILLFFLEKVKNLFGIWLGVIDTKGFLGSPCSFGIKKEDMKK